MELVLLFEVSEENYVLIYSLNQNEEFIVEVLSEEANRYRDYSQANKDFIFVLTEQLCLLRQLKMKKSGASLK